MCQTHSAPRCATPAPPSLTRHPERGLLRAGSKIDEPSLVPFELVCPAGSVVTAVAGRQDPYLWVLGPLTCSDGSATAASGAIASGTAFSYASPSSFFKGFSAYYMGWFMDGATIRMGTDVDSWMGNLNMTGWTSQGASLCAPGSYLAGAYGKRSADGGPLFSLGPICRAAGEREGGPATSCVA